jgi:hypothetical protein
MPFNNNITPGRPPVLWSEVNEAFVKVNENFVSLVATIGSGSGLIPIDFTLLNTSVKPATNNLYDLGDITHQWRSVFTAEHTAVDPLNGLWAGNAQIKGVGYTMNLPTGSTIGGDPVTGVGTSLIIDPDKTFFKEIQVNNDLSVVATTFGDTVNFLSGSGVGLAVSSGADSITFSNTGVLSVTAGSGISSATVSGVATIINTGVRSLQSTVALPSGRTTGAGININGATGDNLRVTNTGVITISSGVGITVSLDAASGDVTITNSAPAGNTFAQVLVNNLTTLAADAASDTLKINSGLGITLTATDIANEDILSIAVNPVFDLKGSVFGDDSTKIVDAVENKVYGGIFATTLRTEDTKIALGANAGSITQGNNATAVGWLAGYNNQGTAAVAFGRESGEINQGQYAVAVGPGAGYTGQGADAIAIGYNAGATSQGASAVAIGSLAGQTSQSANSIVINASGVALNGAAAGFYVNPVRSTTSAARPVVYDTATKELFYTSTLEFINSTISTSDSSGLTVDVQTTFNTDVTFDNDITINRQVTIGGDLIINGTTTTINSVTLTVDDKNIELGSIASPTDVTADGGGITLKGSTDKTFTYVNSTGLWTANIGVAATSFTGLAAAATTASTAASVGYMGIPQSATAAVSNNTTLVIGDAGNHIYITTPGQTVTIPANASVAYPIGTAITFVAGPSASSVIIAIATDTMYLVGAGTSGSRTLAAYGSATAMKVSATVWFIAGTGLT